MDANPKLANYLKPQPAHGLRFSFTSSITSQFSDTSISKNLTTKTRQIQHIKLLTKQSETIKQKKQIRLDLQHKVDSYYETVDYVISKSSECAATEEKMQKAAVVIQRFAKGFLARKKLENEWFAMKEVKLKGWLNEMDQSHGKFLYQVGRLPRIAAVTIQRWFRRSRFYKKIIRIQRVYKEMQRIKEENVHRKIRAVLSVLHSLKIIAELRFAKNREKKLVVIKRKLALLSIKKVFAREKISWKLIRIRIRKYKRSIKSPVKRNSNRKPTITIESLPSQPKPDAKTTQKTIDLKNKIEENKETTAKPKLIVDNIIKTTESKSPKGNPVVIILTSEEKSSTNEVEIVVSQDAKLPVVQPEIADASKNELNINEQLEHLLVPKSNTPMMIENSDSCSETSKLIGSVSQESIVTTTTDKEAKIRAELVKKLEIERQEKIALGKIAYNIRGSDEKRILPYLKTFSGEYPILSPKAELAKPISLVPKTKKTDMPKPEVKRPYIPGSYMRETMAFSLGHNPAEAFIEEPANTFISKIRNDSTLLSPTAAFAFKVAENSSARSRSTESKVGEKMVIASRKFRSNAILDMPLPLSMQQPRRVAVYLGKQPKLTIKESEESLVPVESPQKTQRVSMSFQDALPEYSGFIQQYSKTQRKNKLEPILFKTSKLANKNA